MEASARETRVIRMVVRTVLALAAAALLLYPTDWAVWRLRVALRRRVQCSSDEGLRSCDSTFTAW